MTKTNLRERGREIHTTRVIKKSDPWQTQLGAKIANERVDCAMTQRELADLVGTSGQRIAQIEAGRPPGLSLLRELCFALDLESDYLLFS